MTLVAQIKQEFLQINNMDLFLHIHLLCTIWFTAFFHS